MNGDETACPFCGAAQPARACAKAPATSSKGALTRAAILFVGATAAAACSGQTEEPTTDAGSSDAAPARDGATNDGGPVALYGPAPVDASPGTDAAKDDGGPVALYGPAPIDAGGNG